MGLEWCSCPQAGPAASGEEWEHQLFAIAENGENPGGEPIAEVSVEITAEIGCEMAVYLGTRR